MDSMVRILSERMGNIKLLLLQSKAMKDGINGAVVFELENGIYNEEVIIPKFRGLLLRIRLH